MRLSLLALAVCGLALQPLPRRAVMAGAAAIAAGPSACAASPTVPPAFEAMSGSGFDMLLAAAPKQPDVYYPPSLIGLWDCRRQVTAVEGDAAQAEGAWRLLGGDGALRDEEAYALRYIPQPGASLQPDGKMVGPPTLQAITGADGRRYFGIILDRGFELAARAHGARVTWDAARPNELSYARDAGGPGSKAELAVVQRTVESPKGGWGLNELVRLTTATDVFGRINYAARVRRRFRRDTLESGEPVVAGLEVLTTYRVLEGTALVEFPTSTTKSTIRLTRPKAAPADFWENVVGQPERRADDPPGGRDFGKTFGEIG